MDVLNKIIASLNKEDIRSYKLFSSRVEVSSDRKDWELFDYIKSSAAHYNEALIHERLYKNNPKNSFYRLKNRLLEELGKSILVQNFEVDEVYAIQLITLARIFFRKGAYEVVYYYLKKAENECSQNESYELLDVIYGEYIKLSTELPAVNPELILEKRQANFRRIQSVRQIDDLLAIINYRFRYTQNFQSSSDPIMNVLEQILADYKIDEELKKSPAFKIKMHTAISKLILQKHDYKRAEAYFLSTYEAFLTEGIFTKGNHNIKLQLLTYIVNCLNKNQKVEEALAFLEKLKEAMEEYDKLLYDKYLIFYQQNRVYSYGIIAPDKAIEILEEMKSNLTKDSQVFYDVFVYLNLGIRYFIKKDFKKAIKNISQLNLLEVYKSADVQLRFKIAVFELVLRSEVGDMEVFEYRIQQISKEFVDLFKKKENYVSNKLVSILKLLSQHADLKSNPKAKEAINELLEREKEFESNQPSELVNYFTWLKNKIKKRS